MRLPIKVRDWFRDWAAWHEGIEYGSGYPDSTPIFRATRAARVTEFSSSIPFGAIPPRQLERLCLAMNCCKDRCDDARYVTTMQRFYIFEHHQAGREAAELTAKEYGITLTTMWAWKRRGEEIVANWLRTHSRG